MVYLADPTRQPGAGNPTTPPPKKRSRFWSIFLLVVAFLVIGFFVLMAAVYAWFKSSLQPKAVAIKPHSVLQLKVSGELSEYVASRPLALLGQEGGSNISFLDVLNAIRKAKEDDDIDGLYVRSGGLSMGFAKAGELREALLDFKTSKKFIYAYLEMGSELDYYFASVADSIFMPGEGMIELNGFAVAQIFWQGTLAKLGVEPFVSQFEEYKSAAESYSSKGFGPYSREELQTLLNERMQTYVDAVAASRGLTPAEVRRHLEAGIYSADVALAAHFIDGIRPESDVKVMFYPPALRNDRAALRKEKNRFVTLSQYVRSQTQQGTEGLVRDKEIAVVYGSGTMVPGRADGGGPFNESLLASESFIQDLRRAADEPKVKAIVLRIDSPGGAVLAADAIWAEIQKVKREKPVYASMSDVAASGGYYIAMACDTIIAHPATLTGSIGVISMIPNLSGSLSKIGATCDTIATSPGALFLNPLLKFSDRDKQTFHRIAEPIYKRFVQRVADSRHKSYQQARQVARGRVWSGQSAVQVGLADTLGGLQTALQIAKRRIGVTERQKVRLRLYPEPRDPLDSLLDLIQDFDVQDQAGLDVLQKSLSWLAAYSDPVRRQLAYLFTLSHLSSTNRMLFALPYLPLME